MSWVLSLLPCPLENHNSGFPSVSLGSFTEMNHLQRFLSFFLICLDFSHGSGRSSSVWKQCLYREMNTDYSIGIFIKISKKKGERRIKELLLWVKTILARGKIVWFTEIISNSNYVTSRNREIVKKY